jgi:NADH:ubiquinone oxidoreductase subunit E
MNVSELEALDNILNEHSPDSNALIPVLQAAQEEFGYLPQPVMERISKHLRLPSSTVYGVATFYAQFKLVPTGKRIVKVCRGTACHVRGADRILSEVEKTLDIKSGETSTDMEYTLETVACIGACALAPNITVNNDVYGLLTIKRIGEIFSDRNEESNQ